MSEIISELETLSAAVQKTFGDFSAEQINWRPNAESWSVGQCFDHLIKTNGLFYDELEKIGEGSRQNSFWEKWSPFSALGANLLIKSLRSDAKKFKIPTQKISPPSAVETEIIEKFALYQAELIEKIKRCEMADWEKIKITSPFLKLMTYKLSDGLLSVVEHEKRHFRQAERVTQTSGFPN